MPKSLGLLLLDTQNNAPYSNCMPDKTTPPETQNVLVENVPVDVLQILTDEAKRDQRSRASLIRKIMSDAAKKLAAEANKK